MAAPSKLRSILNANSALVTILAIVVLISSMGFIVMQMSPRGPRIVNVYYYDLNSNELFTAKSNVYPPVQAPSGDLRGAPPGTPAGVRAYVFSCDGCELKNTHFIGWLEMYTPQVKDMMTNPDKYVTDDPDADMAMMDAWDQGHLVRRADQNRWVQASSEEGYMIVQEMQERCGPNGIPEPCMP